MGHCQALHTTERHVPGSCFFLSFSLDPPRDARACKLKLFFFVSPALRGLAWDHHGPLYSEDSKKLLGSAI